MKLRCLAQQWAVAIVVLMLALSVSAITTRTKKTSSKSKSIEQHTESISNGEKEPSPTSSPEKISERQGVDAEYEHYDDSTPIETSDLVKRTQNVNDSGKADKGQKEESPLVAEVRESADEGDHVSNSEFSRESRGNKNPRIYYDETAPRYPQGEVGDVPDFENAVRQLKQKDGNRYYYPKNYLNGKHGPRKGHKPSPSNVGISGKRVPDHVNFPEEAGHGGHDQEHELSFPAGHAHPVGIGHEEHEHAHGDTGEAPYHGVEEHGKYKGHGHGHVSGYGYHHHYGAYRHTIGDKVDAVGKALQVLIPSALLITGVSALFPNRVHVPTTPNKHRQKRSTYYRHPRGMLPPPPVPMIPPEYDDIPSHILHAEHRIMDGNPSDIYPEWGKRQGVAENAGFDPFRVFKGPGPETTMEKIHAALPLPDFPNMPDMPVIQHTRAQYLDGDQVINLDGNGPSAPPSTYDPVEDLPEGIPPTVAGGADHLVTTQMSPNMPHSMEMNERAHPSAIIRRRKPTTRKPPIFMKETQRSSLSQRSSESQNFITKNIKNSLEDIKAVVNPVKAEEEFMASLQNLVTPDIAKALVKNKPQESPPNKFDLSPDGPVMGLLTSYAQHEKESPLCQKRALCELAVKGKGPKATKFEAFLWSVATLVPDVFSEMYDLQEVFQSIRNEKCTRFDCPNPNLDLQLK